MYTPDHFQIADQAAIFDAIEAAPLASLVTMTEDGLMATPVPLLLDRLDGPHGTLYGHVARANPHWRSAPVSDALAVFMGPDAYVSPGWYATKQETGKVVPTWNYVTVQAHGAVEFFTDPDRVLDVVTRLTNRHEAARTDPWAVSDAPVRFVETQLRGIVGVRLPIVRLEGKAKLSQNRPETDRAGVAAGLGASDRPADQQVGALVRRG